MTVAAHSAFGHLAMLLFSVLVAGSFALGSIIAPLIDPAALTAIRFGLAACVIGAFTVLGPGMSAQAFQASWRYGVLGALFAVYFVLMFEALKTATPVSTSAIFTLTPLMSAIFGWFLLRQQTTLRIAVALAIGAIGAIWVIFRGQFMALLAFDLGPGEMLFLIGAVAHAAYTPLVRKLNRGEHPLMFTFGMLVAGTIVTGLYGATAMIETDWAALPAVVWGTLAYLVLFASATTFFLLQYATLHLPSSKVMAYTYLTPSWVIIWQGMMGQGWPPIQVGLGAALSIAALLILLRA